jgi:hypothetical protein
MRTFNKASFEEQAKQFIKSWTRLLSRGKFQEAIDWLDRIENEDNEYVWTEK